MSEKESNDHHDKDIAVNIQSGRGSRDFTFPQQTKISAVITAAITAFGYPAGDSYSLVRDKDKEELEPQRTLISYHTEDNEVLILSASGSGVYGCR